MVGKKKQHKKPKGCGIEMRDYWVEIHRYWLATEMKIISVEITFEEGEDGTHALYMDVIHIPSEVHIMYDQVFVEGKGSEEITIVTPPTSFAIRDRKEIDYFFDDLAELFEEYPVIAEDHYKGPAKKPVLI